MPVPGSRNQAETVSEAAAQRPVWTLHRTDNRDVLALQGDWVAQSGLIPEFPPDGLASGTPGRMVALDATGLGRWDTGLIEFLWEIKRRAAGADLHVDWNGLPESARKLLALLPDSLAEPAAPQRRGFRPLYWLGGKTLGILAESGALAELLAITTKSTFLALLARARVRAVDLLANIRDAGPRALLIVSVVNFLVGAILAFVGAVQLRRFAADIFVADLVGLAVVREMAAVMTGIIMAGRTGGAYAARIATMRGNEELDALAVVGIRVTDYIVLPSVLALAITMPLLYLYGCLVGILGGFAVASAMLNVTTLGYLNQTLTALPFDQFAFGFVKSAAFAVMIGLTSCRIGLLAGRSAADVGTAATKAVVVGIVGIIAMDAVFAVIADIVGI